MTNTKQHTYTRKDGGTTDCYGTLTKESAIEVVCANEVYDGIVNVDLRNIWNWDQLCKYLEDNYNHRIEEVIAG